MSNHLPLEIEEEILHRLPVKSIVKCTSVCKAWNSLITHQTFIYDHLNRTIQAPNHNSSLFFKFMEFIPSPSLRLENAYSLYSSVNQQTDQLSVEWFPLSHLFDHGRYTLFVSTCNGLVCSADYSPLKSATIIIWNPLLRKYIVLPKPITTRRKRKRRRQDLCCYVDRRYDFFFGFGFDSRNNDYKVVRVMNDKRTKDAPHVQVYSLASHIWRSISVTVPQFFLIHRTWLPSVFLNGALHWLVWRYAADSKEGDVGINYQFILSFDVIQETFRKLMLPQPQSDEKPPLSRLLPVEGGHSLAVVNERGRAFCIWVMKDYGITNSWTEIFRLDAELYGGIYKVLSLTSSGKVFLKLDGGAVVLVDPTKESEEPVQIAKWVFVFVSSFVESLFFLNKEPHVLSF